MAASASQASGGGPIDPQSEQPNYAAIAYDLGYSSQQHFISAFKQVLGKTPLQYRKELSVPTRSRRY